jgi:epoxyqueuosine reductase
MNALNREISEYMLSNGASLVGFADLSELPVGVRRFFPYGLSIALALDPTKVRDIGNGAATEYYAEYRRANARMDELASIAENFLKKKGFSALARTTSVVKTDPATKRSDLPHKTLATRAGLGWIGKCALCITPQYGAAQRFTSVLTDARNAGISVRLWLFRAKTGIWDWTVTNFSRPWIAIISSLNTAKPSGARK